MQAEYAGLRSTQELFVGEDKQEAGVEHRLPVSNEPPPLPA